MPATVSAALLQRLPAWFEMAPHPHAADAVTLFVSSGSFSFAVTFWRPELAVFPCVRAYIRPFVSGGGKREGATGSKTKEV